jgi:hypothetical protein
MKDKEKKEIENIAQEIIQLELKCREDKDNVNTYLQKITELTSSLSLEELLEIDEYILTSNQLNN